MTWLFWLGLAVAIGVIAAVTGVKARGTRPVSGTRLMGVARFVLLVLLLLFLYFAWRGFAAR
ncbi:MAG TPA: hypothetical protein VGA31_10225 [Thermoanaerobaculia bacterium]